MKKNVLGRVFGLSLALVMSLSTVAFAADQTAGGSFSATGNITNPKFRLLVPTTATFSVDPFNLIDPNYSIVGGTFGIINKSNIPLNLTVKAVVVPKTGTPATGTGALVVKRLGQVNKTNSANVAKEMSVALVAAETNEDAIDETVPTVPVLASGAAFTIALPETVTGGAFYANAFTAETSPKVPASLVYGLDRPDYGTGVGDDQKTATDGAISATPSGAAAVFTLRGDVNPFATWDGTEATITLAYSFTGISDTNFAATKFVDNSLAKNVINANSSSSLELGATTTLLKYSKSVAVKPAVPYTVVPGTTGAVNVHSVKIDGTALAPTTDYTVTGTTVKSPTIIATSPVLLALQPGMHTVTITMDNGAAVVKTLEVTN